MECPQIPNLDFDEFYSRLKKGSEDERLPLSGSIEVTARCNLKCIHCYINEPAGDESALANELSTGELRRVIDELADEGCLWLLMTGGEPLVRDDFFDFYTHAKKRGIFVTLFTNGTTVTEEIADRLVEWPPYAVEVTLHGTTADTFENVSGVPGSFDECMRGIERLRARELPLNIKSVAMSLNAHEIANIREFAENMGVEFRFDPAINLRLGGGDGPAKLRLSPEEVIELEKADEKRMKAWREFCDKYYGAPIKCDGVYTCAAAGHTFHIDPNGMLSVCMMAREPGYDLRKGSFAEGWREFIPGVARQSWSKESKCRDCRLLSLCDQCPGWGIIEHGDPEAPVDYLCRIAYLRAEALGLCGPYSEGGKLPR